MRRVLVIFSESPDADTALGMTLDALARAGRPGALRFALPEAFEPALRDALAQLPKGTLHEGDLRWFAEDETLRGAAETLRDETHFLALRGVFSFAENWDRTLMERWSRCAAPRALLTGAIEAGQAYLPAFKHDFLEEGVRIGAGVPLVCGDQPLPTLCVDPRLVFGPTDFLRQADTGWRTLSLAAYAAGFSPFALDRAVLWPEGPQRERRLAPPGPLPGLNLARFEQLAGLSFDQRRVSVRASMGLFAVGDAYAQRLPAKMEAEAKARRVLRRERVRSPLMVTAFRDLPEALHPPISYLIRFSWLKALQKLPLLLYAGGEQERTLRARFPNTLAYPDNALLPRSLIYQNGMTETEHFRRCKWPLLERVLRPYPGFTHIAWVDLDVMPHPVCPDAPLDFSALMDDRVHIAFVGGVPDSSFIVAPRRLVRLMARETRAITQMDAELKRSFSEHALIARLMEKNPDLFTVHEASRKGMLFLAGLDERLLSEPLRECRAAMPQARPLPPNPSKVRETL